MANITIENVQIGHAVNCGFNGDCYGYYIVGIERGKYQYNKGVVTGLWIVEADSKCNDYYAGDWEVEPFNPEKHNMNNPRVKFIKKTRKNPNIFTSDGTYDRYWGYHLSEKPYRSENPSF